ncbi:MAG: hypothetical protein R3Y44_00550 [Rikenellaceae bacterium]
MARVTKDILWRGGRFTNHLSRLKFFRGHGVHSPYVYSIVREVFMVKRLFQSEDPLYIDLRRVSIKNQTAIEISNLAKHCHFDSTSIDSMMGKDLIICSEECSKSDIYTLANKAANSGIAIVILSPYRHRKVCNMLLKENNSTSIDRFNYIILLNNHLPKQHFKL